MPLPLLIRGSLSWGLGIMLMWVGEEAAKPWLLF